MALSGSWGDYFELLALSIALDVFINGGRGRDEVDSETPIFHVVQFRTFQLVGHAVKKAVTIFITSFMKKPS